MLNTYEYEFVMPVIVDRHGAQYPMPMTALIDLDTFEVAEIVCGQEYLSEFAPKLDTKVRAFLDRERWKQIHAEIDDYERESAIARVESARDTAALNAYHAREAIKEIR